MRQTRDRQPQYVPPEPKVFSQQQNMSQRLQQVPTFGEAQAPKSSGFTFMTMKTVSSDLEKQDKDINDMILKFAGTLTLNSQEEIFMALPTAIKAIAAVIQAKLILPKIDMCNKNEVLQRKEEKTQQVCLRVFSWLDSLGVKLDVHGQFMLQILVKEEILHHKDDLQYIYKTTFK